MKQILQNFSWDTLVALPPSEFLALVVLAVIFLVLVAGVFGIVASFFD
jgi:hypothetical protein